MPDVNGHLIGSHVDRDIRIVPGGQMDPQGFTGLHEDAPTERGLEMVVITKIHTHVRIIVL